MHCEALHLLTVSLLKQAIQWLGYGSLADQNTGLSVGSHVSILRKCFRLLSYYDRSALSKQRRSKMAVASWRSIPLVAFWDVYLWKRVFAIVKHLKHSHSLVLIDSVLFKHTLQRQVITKFTFSTTVEHLIRRLTPTTTQGSSMLGFEPWPLPVSHAKRTSHCVITGIKHLHYYRKSAQTLHSRTVSVHSNSWNIAE